MASWLLQLLFSSTTFFSFCFKNDLKRISATMYANPWLSPGSFSSLELHFRLRRKLASIARKSAWIHLGDSECLEHYSTWSRLTVGLQGLTSNPSAC